MDEGVVRSIRARTCVRARVCACVCACSLSPFLWSVGDKLASAAVRIYSTIHTVEFYDSYAAYVISTHVRNTKIVLRRH